MTSTLDKLIVRKTIRTEAVKCDTRGLKAGDLVLALRGSRSIWSVLSRRLSQDLWHLAQTHRLLHIFFAFEFLVVRYF